MSHKQLLCYPFIDGSLQNYVHIGLTDEQMQSVYNGEEVVTLSGGHDVVWKPKFNKELVLSLERCGRGRSAVVFYLHDEEGNEYPMFLKDMFDIISHGHSFPLHGIYTAVKRGRNYGIQLVDINNALGGQNEDTHL